MPLVVASEVKLWSRIGGRIESGSMYHSRAEGKAVVARISPLARKARSSNPMPLMFMTVCTVASGEAAGEIEVTFG